MSFMISLARTARRPSQRLSIVALLFFTAFSFLVFRRTHSDGSDSAPNNHPKISVNDVRNETLGFSKVFVVSLPNRSDKRDAVSIAASMTGIKFDWIDGVDGDLIPEKAIPKGWPEEETPQTMGCWRAHMNAIQRMVKEGIPSALIMEDDADWDVLLKTQLVEFAHGTRYLQGSEKKPTSSPYGDDWDLLWLGHCGTRNRENEDQKYYVIPEDPTAVSQKIWGYPRRQPNLTPASLGGLGKHTRVVYEPVRGLCMFGYALSLRGAQKLLYHQALAGKAAVSDRALQRICNDRFLGFKCLAPYPTLIGSHKGAGSTSKDSDREDTGKALGGFREKAMTGQIVYSTRLNLDRLMAGQTLVESQWTDDAILPEIESSAKLPKGHGVYVTKDQYQPYARPN